MSTTTPTPSSAGRNIARQRRFWTSRASSWDHDASSNPSLVKVVEAVIEAAAPRASDEAVDLGCGSGQVTLGLAPKVRSVVAVDISEKMIELLVGNARAKGVENVSGLAEPVESLALMPGSVDIVVTNYALHHLRDSDKPALVKSAYTWLRPGGRLVVGDMMFGRGGDSRDREIIASKLGLLVKKGPGGWWRIAKNAGRYLLRYQERPVSMAAWQKMFEAAGFQQIEARPVVNEAAVVVGVKPPG